MGSRTIVHVGIPQVYVNGRLLAPTSGGVRVHYTKHYPNGLLVFSVFDGKAAPGFAEVKLDFLNGIVDTYKDSEVLSVVETHMANGPSIQRHTVRLGERS